MCVAESADCTAYDICKARGESQTVEQDLVSYKNEGDGAYAAVAIDLESPEEHQAQCRSVE